MNDPNAIPDRADPEPPSLPPPPEEARRQEGLRTLANGLAHEINNLMTTVLGFASLSRLQVEPSSPLAGNLAAIEQAALRTADLCRKLLAYAGGGPVVRQRLDLAGLLREEEGAVRGAVPAGAHLRLEVAGTLPPVEADPDRLRLLLMSLVQNAAEALSGGVGTVGIRAREAAVGAGQLRGLAGHEGLPAGRYVVLEVEDDGCGMDAATRARLFDPFFSTKFLGRGLGLAAALGVVRSHGGAIEVTSEPGRGSAIRVYLPALPG